MNAPLPPPQVRADSLTTRGRSPFSPAQAGLGWFGIWFVATLLAGVAVAPAAVSGSARDTLPVGWTLASLAVQFTAILFGLWLVSRRFGSGDVRDDYGLRFAPSDGWGVAAGVATQFLLIPLVYIPLRFWWPDTFSESALARRTEDLVGGASGVTMVLFFAAVTIGAPLTEELLYRGLLQRAVGRLSRVGAWLGVAVLFAAVHFAPIQFPGLLVAGLVFGLGVLRSDRVGFGLVAHLAFNASAMVAFLATH